MLLSLKLVAFSIVVCTIQASGFSQNVFNNVVMNAASHPRETLALTAGAALAVQAYRAESFGTIFSVFQKKSCNVAADFACGYFLIKNPAVTLGAISMCGMTLGIISTINKAAMIRLSRGIAEIKQTRKEKLAFGAQAVKMILCAGAVGYGVGYCGDLIFSNLSYLLSPADYDDVGGRFF